MKLTNDRILSSIQPLIQRQRMHGEDLKRKLGFKDRISVMN